MLSSLPPNFSHSPASLRMSCREGKGSAAPALRKCICDCVDDCKKQNAAGTWRIKHEDGEKPSFHLSSPAPASWCEPSEVHEVFVPAANHPHLPRDVCRLRQE